ncbi:hypothetical protein EV715DRAFT_297889 [Schizophyllum commune]
MSAVRPSPYVCDPPLFLPPSIPAKGIKYYVVFAPDEYAGVYLSWYHLAAVMRSCGANTRSLDQQGFDTPQSALASWRGTCGITHRHRRPPPSPQGLVFCEENVRWFLANCDCNGVFKDPNAVDGDVGYEPPVGHQPPHPHATTTTAAAAPQTPPPSPRPTPAATRAATPATSRAYTQPSAATRASTPTASRYYSAASGATASASASHAAPAASRSRSGAPPAPGPSSRSARSTTSSASVSSASGSDVVSWLDATASAMADLDLRSDTTGASERDDLQAGSSTQGGHHHRYVVYADGVAPEIVRHWRTAFDRLLELKSEGRRNAKISQRPTLAKAERLVRRLTEPS